LSLPAIISCERNAGQRIGNSLDEERFPFSGDAACIDFFRADQLIDDGTLSHGSDKNHGVGKAFVVARDFGFLLVTRSISDWRSPTARTTPGQSAVSTYSVADCCPEQAEKRLRRRYCHIGNLAIVSIRKSKECMAELSGDSFKVCKLLAERQTQR
jgi:hypothetical protein